MIGTKIRPNSGSETDESDSLPITSAKRALGIATRRQSSGESSPLPEMKTPATEQGSQKEKRGDEETSKPWANHHSILGVTIILFRHASKQSRLLHGSLRIRYPRIRKKARKTWLVSYSSKEDSQDEAVSQSSGRRRTAVTKMVGLMIEYIANKGDAEGKN